MEFVIHPNVYQTGNNSGLRQLLENAWIRNHNSGDGCINIISGFSNFNGGARFYKSLTEHTENGGSIRVFLGGSTSQRLSSKQVVEALLECNAEVHLINRKRLLHAKCYGVSSANENSLVVSSGNFTGPGMSQNIEASLLVNNDDMNNMGFNWDELAKSMFDQGWDIYQPSLTDKAHPAWQLLYDESPAAIEIDETEEQTLVLILGHADTARIMAKQGETAGQGSQYFWLSKDCFDFFPALTIKNDRGWKGTLSTMINVRYININVTRLERVTFEAENNLDFRLGTGPLRYTQQAGEGDIAALTRLSESEYEMRIYKSDTQEFNNLSPYAVTFIGNRGKKYGFIDNTKFRSLI